MTDIPLCKDCKHFRRDWSWYKFFMFPVVGQVAMLFPLVWKNNYRWSYEYAKCARTGKPELDLINPNLQSESTMSFCSTQRKYSCGPEGKFFEARR